MSTRSSGRVLLPSFFSAVLFLLLSACGGSSDENTSAPASCETSQATVQTASFDALWTTVFQPQCAACHGAGTYSGTEDGPDMRTKDAFYNGLVGKKGSDYELWDSMQKNRVACLNYPLIGNTSGSANQSLVVAILDRSLDLKPCEVKNHRDIPQSVCITGPNLVKLKEWINAGSAR